MHLRDWVRTELIGEIAYRQRTPEGRFRPELARATAAAAGEKTSIRP